MADEPAYSFHPSRIHGEPRTTAERRRREGYLDELLDVLAVDHDRHFDHRRVSYEHGSWRAWLDDTGELPPDFARMPAVGRLPDPLRREEDGEWTTIEDVGTWRDHRNRLREQLAYWLYGPAPSDPESFEVEDLARDERDGGTAELLELSFGPDDAATLRLEVLCPPGEGPAPVFLTQWNHRQWGEIAYERGYAVVRYAAADARDDTAAYPELYSIPDCQVLAHRAWGASRAVDYIEADARLDEGRVGFTGHSRNGKQSLLAAAFDERIDAVVVSSAGSGGVVPARLDRDDCYAGDMSFHARVRPNWFHPRWRFFVGRENYLPVDANSLVSLVAPRHCLLFTATHELTSTVFGVEQVYRSAADVYDLLGVPARLAIDNRPGDHATATRDINTIVDFFDAAFDRRPIGPPDRRVVDFHLDEWRTDRSRSVSVADHEPRSLDNPVTDEVDEPRSSEQWSERRESIRERVRSSLGERPPRTPRRLDTDGTIDSGAYGRRDTLDRIIGRPGTDERVDSLWLSPYHAAGRPFGGELFFPRGADAGTDQLPAVVWVHPYSYNAGYGNGGRGHVPLRSAIDREFGLFAYDQLGFGTRMAEHDGFYDRHPGWTKMGKLVADVRAAVETVRAIEFVDPDRVCVLGYSLGATAALYAAALDDGIPAVATVAGVVPLRSLDGDIERTSGAFARLTETHGLQPTLAPFNDEPERIPFDFHEVMAAIAPRPQLVVAPERDWTHPIEPVRERIELAEAAYAALGAADRFGARTPDDILSFDGHEARLRRSADDLATDRRAAAFDWIADTL